MQNGHDKSPATIQINPQQAAAFALEFLSRAAHTHGERERFDMAFNMLQAIAAGQVVLAQPQPDLPKQQPEATQ